MKYLQTRFEITIMNPDCFVGLQIDRNRTTNSIRIHQANYIDRILERFNMFIFKV